MKREILIRKWLDNELSKNELEAFKNLDDYKELIRIGEASKRLTTPDYEVDVELQKLDKNLNTSTSKLIFWKPLLRVAAMIMLLVGIYFTYAFISSNKTLQTDIAQKDSFELPDESFVTLNAVSRVSYSSKSWGKTRSLTLDGEAYFKVKKGKTFNIITSNGTVSVLGTQFNVYSRADSFEVYCYEGSVQVESNGNMVILEAGDRFRESVKIPRISTEKVPAAPSWTRNESIFKNTPFGRVIAEFERQYNAKMEVDHSLKNQLFTGAFTHNDIDLAIRSISLPFNLSYTKTGNEITLKSE